MFELSSDDIAQLGDEDLRELVARLCLAEVEAAGLPISSVTFGGDQNAPDGGLDVRVRLPAGSPTLDFIPCPETGFQVKVPDLGGASIRNEMRPRPHQTLRASIVELVDVCGAVFGVVAAPPFRRDGPEFDETLIACGRELLSKAEFAKGNVMADHHLAGLAKKCLTEDGSADAARAVCRRFATALEDYRSVAHEYDDFIAALFFAQPRIAMEEFLLRTGKRAGRQIDRHFRYASRKPLFHVPENIIIDWAKENPAERCVALASSIPLFEKSDEVDDGGSGSWTGIARKLLELSPNKAAFLSVVASRFMPSGWSGSLAAILEDRRKLPQALFGHPDATVASWAREQDAILEGWVQLENQKARRSDESFE